ncbi:DUF5827 family protein [Salinirubellus salinus]|uniref:DUF5827 family protein n=1 Tax=Salinirubellus salinus TaxID=1364945 RepID=A0A9E7R6H6_9EURY|nr:DUF5827 family protein [Salinirubellus salinus]UWM56502.1 DUF5827 family protein [Salinirubellus salinus]
MPKPKSEFDDLRALEFRDPDEVLESDQMYTVYEVARLLQGVAVDQGLDVETENVLLDWAIPWMIYHQESFVFANPASDEEPGYYGLAE